MAPDTAATVYRILVDGSEVARFDVPQPLSSHESADPVLVSIEREDGAYLVGIDFTMPYDATVGHWPDGEEWEPLGHVRPVLSSDEEETHDT